MVSTLHLHSKYITGGQKKLSITVNTFHRQILNASEKRYNSKLLESMNLL